MQPKPIFTELPIKGLTTPVTILQITDLHAAAMNEEELSIMSEGRRDYNTVRIAHFTQGRPYHPEEILPVLMQYAAEVGADVTLLTGDILDFPSEQNLSILADALDTSPVPALYITGNHDWSFADDYHTPNARATYLPRVEALSRSTDGLAVYETETFVLAALDDSTERVRPETVDAYIALSERTRAVKKPLILSMHIPLYAATLTEDTARVWGRDICLGPLAFGRDDPATMRFYEEVAVGTAHAPDALITGHLHFHHEDLLENGTPQLVTDIASGGTCRVIRLLPA